MVVSHVPLRLIVSTHSFAGGRSPTSVDSTLSFFSHSPSDCMAFHFFQMLHGVNHNNHPVSLSRVPWFQLQFAFDLDTFRCSVRDDQVFGLVHFPPGSI